MVRILPSGEVVQDDDPRAKQQRQRPSANINTLQHNDEDEGMHGEGQGQAQGQTSPILQFFLNLNQKLAEAGVPKWNLGPYEVEPIVSAAFLLALLLIGFRGLLFGLLLFFASKWSMGGGTQQRRPGGGSGGHGLGGHAFRGHRLGRN